MSLIFFYDVLNYGDVLNIPQANEKIELWKERK